MALVCNVVLRGWPWLSPGSLLDAEARFAGALVAAFGSPEGIRDALDRYDEAIRQHEGGKASLEDRRAIRAWCAALKAARGAVGMGSDPDFPPDVVRETISFDSLPPSN